MPDIPPKRSLPTSEQPSSDFSWPLTDDELAPYGVETVHDEISEPKRSLSTLSEQPRDDFAWPPTDDELTQYGIETVQGETSEPVFDGTGLKPGEPPLANVALTQSDTARERSGPGDWAAEMARLQGLIEELTQPVQWRISSAPES